MVRRFQQKPDIGAFDFCKAEGWLFPGKSGIMKRNIKEAVVMRRIRISAILVAFLTLLSGSAAWSQEAAEPQTPLPAAENAQPALPDPGPEPRRPEIIEAAAQQGAQVRYLGNREGFDGWLLLTQGTPSYIYISEDGETIFQGLMYDGDGQAITMQQIGAVQAADPGLSGGQDTEAAASQATDDARSPGETLYDALSVVNFITLGSADPSAPLLYAFMDPDCPHCKEFLQKTDAPYLANNKIQLRVIPVGVLGDDSMRRAAYLLSQPNGGDLLMAHAKKEKTLPTPEGLTLDGQQLNNDLFHLWRFDGTPILVFKDKSGTIMMVRGMPKDLPKLMDSIAEGSGA